MNATYMQEVEACPSTLTTGQVYQIKDQRGEQTYNVAKLANNKCWMVENLNIAGDTELSADDTDVINTYIYSFSTDNGRLIKRSISLVLPASSSSGFDADNKTSACRLLLP